jgi:hypothetical protein
LIALRTPSVRALEFVPKPKSSLFTDAGHQGCLHILAEDKLFLVEMDRAHGHGEMRVAVTTRVLSEGTVTLRQFGLEETDQGPAYRREWQFDFPGDEPLLITGRVMPRGIGVDERADDAGAVCAEPCGLPGWRPAVERQPWCTPGAFGAA